MRRLDGGMVIIMQYKTKNTNTDTQLQDDIKELFAILSQSGKPEKVLNLAVELVEKVASLTPEEFEQVKEKAQKIQSRRTLHELEVYDETDTDGIIAEALSDGERMV